MCLQEVWDSPNYSGYKSLYKRRTNKEDGCAILWKADRFTLERHDFQASVALLLVGLADRSLARSQDLDQIVYPGGNSKAPMVTCNTGVIAVLFDRMSNTSFLVATVQLFWNRCRSVPCGRWR